MNRDGKTQMAVSRRAWLAGMTAASLSSGLRAAELPVLRLGVLQLGTVHWVAEIIRRRGLDRAHGFSLEPVVLANTDAGRVAVMARSADVVVSDWFFVANQREAGTALNFAPFSSATGGLMVPQASPIRGLADLKGRRLGVAGGPVDKAWLVFRAAAREIAQLDVAASAQLVYGAPPLLNAKLRQGELDAVLTFWNFAARLEAEGCREVISVAACGQALGLPEKLSLIGFVFHEAWARQQAALLNGFMAAVAETEQGLMTADTDWQTIRPLMDAPDDALYDRLRQRFRDGVDHSSAAAQQSAAERLFAILLRTGGRRATGDLETLPEGIFWRAG